MTRSAEVDATRAPRRLLAAGVALFVLGRLIDLWWHATHPEFETASDQLRAHAVVWVGALVMMWAAALALTRGSREGGFIAVALGALGYTAVAVWHFIEHANGRDPDLPHLLLLVTNLVMLAGAAWVWLTRYRLSPR